MVEYGLIGESLKHSWSKEIHNSIYDYSYDIVSLPKESFSSFVLGENFKGLNVTIPYKEKIIDYCKDLSKIAKDIGSVNTVTVDKRTGNLMGYNTDYDGFLYMCNSAGISFDDKKVLILGSGGTSKTARIAAYNIGASEVAVISRQKVDGKDNKCTGTYDDLHKFYDFDIIVNTTPVGMYPDTGRNIIDLADFPKCTGIIDVIYNPMKSRLLLAGEEAGIKCTNGLPMLVAQAKYAGDIFLKNENKSAKTKDDEIIEEIINKIILENTNIILVGMPGAGKTSVGKAVGKLLSRSFIDTDEEIVKEANMPIENIFKKWGEKDFRGLESAVIEKYGKEKGAVISVGGGGILRNENIKALKQNGFIVWLKRDIEKLATDGRPLSIDVETLKEMFDSRRSIYEKASDFSIDNNGSTQNVTAEYIVKDFNKRFSGLRKD